MADWEIGGLNKTLGQQRMSNLLRGNGMRTNCEAMNGITLADANRLADIGLHLQMEPSRNGNSGAHDMPPMRGPIELKSHVRDELALEALEALQRCGSNADRDTLIRAAQTDSYTPSVPASDDYWHRDAPMTGRSFRELVYGK